MCEAYILDSQSLWMALLISNLDFKVVNLDMGLGRRKNVVACNTEETSPLTDRGAFLAWL